MQIYRRGFHLSGRSVPLLPLLPDHPQGQWGRSAPLLPFHLPGQWDPQAPASPLHLSYRVRPQGQLVPLLQWDLLYRVHPQDR